MYVSSVLSSPSQVPIIQTGELQDTFTPETYGDWDYYILPPGTSYRDIEYWGTSTNLVYYTTTGADALGDSQITPFSLTRGDLIPNQREVQLLENSSRDSNHDFIPGTPYPRAVRIDTDANPTFNQSITKPLSLHMDYSSTFYAEQNVLYSGFVESSDPFYLDVSFTATNVWGILYFEQANPPAPGYIVGMPENEMTYPIFPKNESLLTFTLATNGSTIVTLTPHPWTFPTSLPALDANTLINGELSQGEPWQYDQATDQLIEPEYDFFSIRMFDVPLVKDQFYRLSAIFDMEDVRPGVSSAEPVRFLIGDHYEEISGSIDQDGMVIRARETENATLVLYSPGETNGQYSIFYQEIPPTTIYETMPLPLNTNTTLEENIYYTFTLGTESMMAINWTETFDLTFYIPGAYPDQWIDVTSDNFFSPNTGNLYGDTVEDIGNVADWRYMPAGSYAITVDSAGTLGREIRFTTVPIQQPGTLQVNQDSLFAIELPIVRNQLNWINLSTTDDVFPLQQILYEWTFIGKYNELISAQTNSDWFGNENSTNVWEAWDYNDTIINALLPTREYERPILMIRPFQARNWTLDQLDTFSASLTVSTNVALNPSATAINALGSLSPFVPNIPTANLYSGQQFFIPLSAISATTEFRIDDTYSPDDDHLYGIPLTLDPYSIYNITVFLKGNHSNYTPDNDPSDFLNATFYNEAGINIHGGNLQSLEIFGTQIGTFENESLAYEWRSLLILTVSGTSYLFVDLERQWNGPQVPPYFNATLRVEITKLNIPNLEFQIDTAYDANASEQEVFNNQLIVTEIIPPEMLAGGLTPPFPLDALLLVGGVVGIGVAAAAGVYFVRKRREGY